MHYISLLLRLRNGVLASLLGLALSLTATAQEDTVLVFNELMYHPSDEESEWVELVSLYGVDLDISQWSLDGAVRYTFPEGTIVPGNSYLVVAADPGGIPEALGPFEGRLDNGGEELRLLNNSGRVMSILDYNDRGEWPVAPDGSGVTLAKRHPLLLASDRASWHWSDQIGGSPGAANFGAEGPRNPEVILNEVAGLSSDDFFIEIAACPCPDPLGDAVLPLAGYEIRTSSGESYILTDESVTIGSFVSIAGETLGFENLAQGDRVYLFDPDSSRILDAALIRQRTRARFPDGAAWHIATTDTPGETNDVALQDAIVINEIMYHYRPTYGDDDVAFQPNPEEWIELFNRGDGPVDLSGWALEEGIRYEFPEGTVMQPGAYLVVARDAEALQARIPAIAIIGDYSGQLSNSGERVVLIDDWGNPADVVEYEEGGDWPEWADGDGSSLELRHPDSDNNKAGSWGASDEGSKSSWQTYSYRGTAERPPGTNFPNQWDEFNFGLLNKGEFLIDDISVIEDPDGAATNLIRNRTFSQSIFGGDGTQNWRFRGTHGGHGKTRVVPDPEDEENTVLHVVATGLTEHMHNQIETTLSGNSQVSVGTEYEISFRAKWLAGTPQLHTRLYFNYLAEKTILDQPDNHGTPGAANSILEDNHGPAYAGLMHRPAVPGDQEPIIITVDAVDSDGIESLEIKWRTDLAEDFASVVMEPVAQGGEGYRGVIPGQAAQNLFGAYNETKIQYYLEGKDSAGNVTWWPEAGPESRALIPLDDGRQGDTPGHNLRIVMMDPDRDFMHEVTNVMSNHRMKCTLIDREEHVYYDVGVRLKGSERGRNQSVRVGFSLKMRPGHPFHGLHRTVAVDRSGAGNQFSQKEMLVKHAINRAGEIPGMYDDLIYIISPDADHEGSAMFLKARYDDEYLDGQFENGSEGSLFEYELIYYPTTAEGGVEGLKRPEPDSVTGVPHRNLGPDQETYRWHYLLKNNRAADDYARLMDMLDLFGSSADDAYFERLWDTIDVEQWLRAYAIQNLFGIGDNYANGSQHNMMIYFPPGGKAMYFPWDMDFTFSQGATSGIANNSDLNKMLRDPVAFRSYYAQMDELLQRVFNREYMERWTEHYSTFLPRENLGNFADYIENRNRHVEGQLRSGFERVPFQITSMGGENFEVAASTVTLEGKGWFNIASVRVGDTQYELTWIDKDVWQLTLPLARGENVIEIQALDVLGTTGSVFAPLGKDTITVTNTGSMAAANGDNLIVSEIMYHPAAPNATELEAGFTDQDDFEFIELHNISEDVIDLAGARFSNGIEFRFPEETQISAGGYLVLVANAEAFLLRYPGVSHAGEYEGRLRNSGETLGLRAVDDTVIHEFSYNDTDPWPLEADGEGFSLVLTRPVDNPDPNLPESWNAGASLGGTPGAGEQTSEPNGDFAAWLADRGGDPLADPDGNGIPLIVEYGVGFDLGGALPTARMNAGTPEFVYHRRTAGDVTVTVQSSQDLRSWQTVSQAGASRDLGNGLTEVVIAVDDAYARLQITP